MEMVHRYAHLSNDHLSEHASKIDAISNRNVTNMAQEENVVYIDSRYVAVISGAIIGTNNKTQLIVFKCFINIDKKSYTHIYTHWRGRSKITHLNYRQNTFS